MRAFRRWYEATSAAKASVDAITFVP